MPLAMMVRAARSVERRSKGCIIAYWKLLL